MSNKLMIGSVVGCALLIGFAAGRLTSSSEPVIKDASEKASGKAKLATTKRTNYKMPKASAMASANTPEPQADNQGDNTNRFGRGRGNFDPAAYATMMKERAVSERSNLFASAALSPAQQQDFDDLVTAMNSSLKQRTEKLAAMMQSGKQIPPEMGYHMLHEYASSMMRSYEMKDRTMPAGWREKVGDSFNMRNFMDPSIREATRGLSRGGGGPPGGFGGGPGGDRGGGPGGQPRQ